MASYQQVSPPTTAVAVDATTPVKLFTTPAAGRLGWRVYNCLAGDLYISIVPTGTSAPSFADMVTNGKSSFRCPSGYTLEDGARAGCDVYAVMSSGTGNLYPQEIKI